MRDVAVVSYAASAVAKETRHNEVEIITPVIRDAVQSSGIPAKEIGFTCSGSLDYLFGGPFAFVQGIDAVGAWPPIRESHVEMDAAWALYEAWIAIQTGEVDSALIYGFSKGSLGDVAEIMAMQHDPYYLTPLWPSMFDLAAMQARCYLEESGQTERDLAEVAARAQRNGRSNPHAVRMGDVTADDLLGDAGALRPAARERRVPGERRRDGRGDRGRRRCPQRVRTARVDPRHRAPHRSRTRSGCATSRARSRRAPPALRRCRQRERRRRRAARAVLARGAHPARRARARRLDRREPVGWSARREHDHGRGSLAHRRGRRPHPLG